MSEKECDQCFNMVDDDESLCEDCEEQERQLDEEDDLDLDDLDEDVDFSELDECTSCGASFDTSELNDSGECYDCRHSA